MSKDGVIIDGVKWYPGHSPEFAKKLLEMDARKFNENLMSALKDSLLIATITKKE